MIPKEDFEKFNNQTSFEKCLDIEDRTVIKVTDEQAKKIIEKHSHCKNLTEFQKLSETLKEKYIIKFHSKGMSIRQIARLCGESKGVVEKHLKQKT